MVCKIVTRSLPAENTGSHFEFCNTVEEILWDLEKDGSLLPKKRNVSLKNVSLFKNVFFCNNTSLYIHTSEFYVKEMKRKYVEGKVVSCHLYIKVVKFVPSPSDSYEAYSWHFASKPISTCLHTYSDLMFCSPHQPFHPVCSAAYFSTDLIILIFSLYTYTSLYTYSNTALMHRLLMLLSGLQF